MYINYSGDWTGGIYCQLHEIFFVEGVWKWGMPHNSWWIFRYGEIVCRLGTMTSNEKQKYAWLKHIETIQKQTRFHFELDFSQVTSIFPVAETFHNSKELNALISKKTTSMMFGAWKWPKSALIPAPWKSAAKKGPTESHSPWETVGWAPVGSTFRKMMGPELCLGKEPPWTIDLSAMNMQHKHGQVGRMWPMMALWGVII